MVFVIAGPWCDGSSAPTTGSIMRYLGWLLLSFFTATTAIAANGEKKAFPLPDKSSLVLTIPAGWKDELKENPGSAPASIVLSPRNGTPFQVVVTSVARQGPGASVETAIKMRQSVQQAADKVKPSAVEPYLSVEELPGAPAPGYYFSATDREPKPGEYKYLTQGMLLVGDLVLSFSVLTNDGQEKVRDEALALLKNASHAAR
jgi:hypothetical protein